MKMTNNQISKVHKLKDINIKNIPSKTLEKNIDYISVEELKNKLNGRFDVRQIRAIKKIIDDCHIVKG